MKFLAIVLMVLHTLVHEAKAVDVVCDPWTSAPKPTHIAVKVDGGAFVEVPVALDASGNPFCRYSLNGLKSGAHTILMRAVLIDDIWGRLESVDSAPFAFSKPVAPVAPSGLLVK